MMSLSIINSLENSINLINFGKFRKFNKFRKGLKEIFNKNIDKDMSDNIVMYIVLNSELNMSRGKIASQSAHAACDVVAYLVKNPNPSYYRWKKDGQPKIVLKANTKQMEEMEDIFYNRSKNIWCSSIRDAGKTEVDEGSLTAIAFSPNRKGDIPEIIKKLKLL